MASLLAEKLVAVRGVEGFLRGDPVRVTMAQAEAADRLSSRIRRELRAFFGGESLPAPSPQPFDYKRAIRLLIDDPNDARMLQQIRDDEAAPLVLSAMAPILRRLADIVPRRSMKSLLGTKSLPPSDAEIAAFRRAWEIANDPMSILAALRSGAISRDQAAQLEVMYPGLYAEMRSALFEVVASLKAQRPRLELPPRKDKALQAFLQARVWDAALAADLQAAFAPQEDEGEPPRRKPPELSEAQALPTRRLEAR